MEPTQGQLEIAIVSGDCNIIHYVHTQLFASYVQYSVYNQNDTHCFTVQHQTPVTPKKLVHKTVHARVNMHRVMMY